ncbi:MAG: M48 metallopeptidase family protein, partial [Burkholderiales bacterium]
GQAVHSSERAITLLRRRVDAWALKLKVSPRVVRVQRMTRKWGSCSARGTITLATDLVEQDRRFQDFVVAHELLHLRVPNHGRLFKALMTTYVPNWRAFDVIRSHGPCAMPRQTRSGRTIAEQSKSVG